MALNKARLDRFLAQYCQISRKDVRLMLAKNRVKINGVLAHDIDEIIDTFSHITLDGQVIQANSAHYIMLTYWNNRLKMSYTLLVGLTLIPQV